MKILKFQSNVTSKQNSTERYFESNPWYITVFEKTNIQYKFDGLMLKQRCCKKKYNRCCCKNKTAYFVLLSMLNLR